MWFQKRGIVVSIKKGNCIVVTPDGTYEKVPLPSREVQVGEEVTYNRVRFPAELKPVLMAASFLLVLLSSILLYQANLNPVAAYVTLDMNSSLEILVDRNLMVIDMLCLDEDAARLVKPGEYQGKSLNDAISGVIDKAVEHNYIKLDEENLIVSTVSRVKAGAKTVDPKAIYKVVEESVVSKDRKVQVKVYTTSDDIRKKANNAGISSGKYLIFEQIKKNGKPVKIDDVKKNSVKNLVEKHQVKLPPNYQKFTSNKDKSRKPEVNQDNNRNKVPGQDKDKKDNRYRVPGQDKDKTKNAAGKYKDNPRDNDSRDEWNNKPDNDRKDKQKSDKRRDNNSRNDSRSRDKGNDRRTDRDS
jgi:hypothetical protein